ncbi:hypothetical protein [Paenibacillus sp. RC67]|uniref:hypothetical protein n=1 Tax=Paenibacillus sp. RC67 TaxID=3039392 RepID=UPI0024AD8F63|nr:hypothetical protein [Paenibacillus sp. RC67]
MTINGQQASSGKRVLLTGGRAPATLDLARQLAANGHWIFMAESCPEHLCRQSRAIQRCYLVPEPAANPKAYVGALRQIINEERIEWLLPMCEELFYVAGGLSELSSLCRVFVEPLDRLRRLHSKWEFMQRVQKIGFSIPKTQLLTSQQDCHTFMEYEAEQASLRQATGEAAAVKWVFKPVFSRFSSKVIIAEVTPDGWQPRLRINTLPISADMPWVVQQYIEGTAYCSYSIVHQGQMTAHAVYPVGFTAGIGACISFEAISHPWIDRWVERFVQEEGFTGQIAFDFIEVGDGTVYPLECNPRATSGIHLFRVEDRLDEALFMQEVYPQKRVTPRPEQRAMITVAMASYGLAGLLSSGGWRRFPDWIRFLVSARDVVFRPSDPQPFWQQFRLVYWNGRRGAKQRIPIMEASTQDIEWNGGEMV